MGRNLKILFLVKLIAVIAYVAYDFGWVHIGERLSFAASEEASKAATPTAEANPLPNKDQPSSAGGKVATADDGYQEAERPKPTRKSFLDDLLDVPRIDTEPMTKEEQSKYIALLEKKHKQVEERVSLLAAREERLVDIEKGIDTKLAKLDEEKQFFLDTVQKEKQMTEERTKQLVEFYKKMAPKSAAPVFEKLDKDLVVTLFNNLPQKQITAILGLMSPDTSVKLTEYYGRIRSGKEYELLKEINTSLATEFDKCKGM